MLQLMVMYFSVSFPSPLHCLLNQELIIGHVIELDRPLLAVHRIVDVDALFVDIHCHRIRCAP